MKKHITIYTFIIMWSVLLFTNSCVEESTIPIINTSDASEITPSKVTLGGLITSDGGAEVTSRGVCWSKTQNPTIEDNKTTDGSGTGSFISQITNLTIDTKYYVRAYATNSVGTGYGLQITVTPVAALPSLSTTVASSITGSSAICGGNINNDGGGTIISRGVCWSTTELPTILNFKTNNGTGIGIFTSSITALNQGETYFVRAYATNNSGTSYGNQITFKTLSIPTVSTSNVITITETSAISGGDVTDNGGLTLSARGVCWNTTGNPTTSNFVTNNGNSTGAFISNIAGLASGTTYYLRAYATNTLGTGYGNEFSFTTKQASSGTITDVDGNVYHFLTIGSQVWLVENLRTTKYRDGSAIPLVTGTTAWGNLTTPAYCWYNNDESSNKNTYGALYNWYAIETGKLAPTGWRVASNDDWQTLIDFAGGYSVAGGKLKETGTSHWTSPNTSATNLYGFTALPGGLRDQNYSSWVFTNIGKNGYWWSSNYLLSRSGVVIDYNHSSITDIIPGYGTNKNTGMSVKCIRN